MIKSRKLEAVVSSEWTAVVQSATLAYFWTILCWRYINAQIIIIFLQTATVDKE